MPPRKIKAMATVAQLENSIPKIILLKSEAKVRPKAITKG